MTDRPAPHWMTAAEAAQSLGIAARTFRSWQVEPVATIDRTSHYDAAGIIRNRLDAEKQRTGRADTPLADLKAEADRLDTELVRLRAARQELRNAELRGELVRVEEIAQRIANAAAASGVVLDALPGKLRRFVSTLNHTDVDRIRATVVRHQNKIAGEAGPCADELPDDATP